MYINPALLSKINWTNVIAAIATLSAVFGFNLTPETQVMAVSMIALGTQLLTVILRTFATAKPAP